MKNSSFGPFRCCSTIRLVRRYRQLLAAQNYNNKRYNDRMSKYNVRIYTLNHNDLLYGEVVILKENKIRYIMTSWCHKKTVCMSA